MHDADGAPGFETELEALVAACIEAQVAGDGVVVERLLEGHPQLAAAARAQLDDLQRTGLLDARPQRIGNYRVVDELGHGGMGTVYLAEQLEPVQRRVALKLIKPGMNTRDVIARFAAERQTLARMQHANVATVFDAGVTADGQPYFVMEYVDGVPITEYAERHRLATPARLRLFLQACEGVQHAHLKGIIHRDLKPSNILVAETDGKAVPKIIDFGIAKAVEQEPSPLAQRTECGVLLGTPEYMSPEQARYDAQDVDLRTDVYSLGVVLYELLTGTLPFPSDRLRTSHAEMQRILRDEPPTAPSRRLRSLAGNGAALGRTLRGDLDWICLAALAKERDRRYATVNALAADVQRHLDRQPVLVGAPSRLYRLRRFVQRHRLQVAAAAAVLLALVGGLVLSAVSYGRESAARDAAEANFRNAMEAVDRMLTRVADALQGAPRMDALRRGLLEDATELYGRFAKITGGDHRARFEAARAQVGLARMSQLLGQSRAAATAMDAALVELQRLADNAPGDARYAAELVKARLTSSQLSFAAGSLSPALAAVDAAMVDLDRLLRATPDAVELHQTLQACLDLRGRLLRQRDPKAAIGAYRRALQEGEWLAAAGVRDRELMRAQVFGRVDLAGAMYLDGDVQGSERELLAARAQMAELGPRDDWDVKRAEVEADLARKTALVVFDLGRPEAAVAAADEEIAIARQLVAEHPLVASYRSMLATAYGNLARFRSASGLDDGVIDAFRAAVDMLEDTVRAFPEVPDFRRRLASYSGNVARAYLLQHRARSLPLAEPYVRRALQLFEEQLARDPGNGKTVDDFGIILVNAAFLADAAGRVAEADALFERAIAVVSPLAAADTGLPGLVATIADASFGLAQTAAGRRDWVAARTWLDRAEAALQRFTARAPDDPALRETGAGIVRLDALLAAHTGDHAAAAAKVDAVVAAFPADSWMGPMAAADILQLCWRACHERQPGLASDYAGRASRRYREAIAMLDRRLAARTDIELESVRAAAEVALAGLQAAAGELSAAAALLDKALAVLVRNRTELPADPFADERLADGERLAAAIEAQRNPR